MVCDVYLYMYKQESLLICGLLPDVHGHDFPSSQGVGYAGDSDGHFILRDQFKNLFAMHSAPNSRNDDLLRRNLLSAIDERAFRRDQRN